MRGLLDRNSLAPGEGLIISKCDSIHTVGMRVPIDVIFLAYNGRVMNVVPSMPPGRKTQSDCGGAHVLELPSGMAQSTEVGDQLVFHRF